MYPEHRKLHLVVEQSQRLGEFLEWLGQEGLVICEYTRDEDWPWTPLHSSIDRLLGRYFGIDLAVLEREKRAMLDEQRALNARVREGGAP